MTSTLDALQTSELGTFFKSGEPVGPKQAYVKDMTETKPTGRGYCGAFGRPE